MARAYVYDMVDTWNAGATTFTAIKMNVTDTASAAGSLLMNLQVNGVDRFRILKTGSIISNGGYVQIGNDIGLNYQAGGEIILPPTGAYSFGSSGLNTPDLFLRRDAANTLAQRNGTSAQTFRVYNTYTDASNYERQELTFQSNVTRWFSTAAGTGTIRNMEILRGSTQHWLFNSSGNNFGAHLLASTDNTYDIGAGGANRPRAIYTAGLADIRGSLYVGGAVEFIGVSAGVVTLREFATSAFNRLQFGGTSSAFPALKRNATALETKLADDSAYAPHAMQFLDVTDGITAPASATGRARIYVDTADGDLKIIFADGTIKTIVTDT